MTSFLTSLYSFVLTNRVETLILLIIVAVIVCLAYLLYRKWQESEKLKYEFITIIAHTFRTPLTQMKWLIENLLPAEADPYKKESLENMRQSNQRLVSLTTTLIELTDSDNSSKSSYTIESINVTDLVKNTVEMLKKVFHEKNLFFAVQYSDPELIVNADRARLEYVIQTILENAFTYTPPGRNIDIRVIKQQVKKESYVTISVKDDGIGIEKGELGRLFTKFYRAQSAQSVNTDGFGMGLYMAQSVTRRMGGHIEAYSEGKNRGSTFVIVLPLAKESLPATENVPSSPASTPVEPPVVPANPTSN